MNFLNPAYLFWLLLVLPLIGIYFIKVKPRVVKTATLFLWDRVFQRKANSLFKKLKDFISLILMLLTLIFLVLAISGISWQSQEEKNLFIIIDNSPSMSARSGEKTRLELAKAKARELVVALGPDQQACVSSLSDALRSHANLSNSVKELQRGIDAVEGSLLAFNAEALQELLKDEGLHEDYRFLLISDGSHGDFSKDGHFELLKVGEKSDNVGIVAFDAKILPSSELGVYFRLSSSHSEEKTVQLSLAHEKLENVYRAFSIKIAPGKSKAERYEVPGAPVGRWILKIEDEDSLTLDNVAHAVVFEPEPIRVSVSAGNERYFIDTFIQAFIKAENAFHVVEKGAEMAIGVGKVESSQLANFNLLFKPQGESVFWKKVGAELEDDLPVRVHDQEHEIFRFLSADKIPFQSQRKLELKEGALVLVENSDGDPLIALCHHEGKRAMVVNMDPLGSGFFMSSAFPVLSYSIATSFLSIKELDAALSPGTRIRPGDILPVQGEMELQAPSGDKIVMDADALSAPLEELGFYTLKAGEKSRDIAVSIIGDGESRLSMDGVESTHAPISSGIPLSFWLIIAALMICSLESMLYHRKKV